MARKPRKDGWAAPVNPVYVNNEDLPLPLQRCARCLAVREAHVKGSYGKHEFVEGLIGRVIKP